MRRNLFVFTALCVALAMTTLVSGGPGDDKADPTQGATYIGQKSCKKCHMKQHRSWKKMAHAKAWELLDEKYRTADAKDDDGRACISCHVTGYGQKDRGGFVDPEASKHLLGVQCEACHGPGSNHKKAGQAVLDAKRKKFNEDEQKYITRKTTNCSNCHNPHINHKKYKKGG